MNVSYRRDREHNYMVIEAEGEFLENSYQIRMLMLNEIPGLLKCELRILDGVTYFYYEITSRQPLERIFKQKSIGYGDLTAIYTEMEKALASAARYLLDENCFLLEPEYMYMDPETRNISFCYLPSGKGDIEQSVRGFAEYILKKLNHEDEQAVLWGYRIYNKTMQENYSVIAALQIIYQKPERERPEPRVRQERKGEIQGERDFERLEDSEESVRRQDTKTSKDFRQIRPRKNMAESERTGFEMKLWIVGMVGILCCGIVAVLLWFSRLNLTQAGGLWFVIVGISLYLGAGRRERKEKRKTGSGFYRSKKKEYDEEEPWQEYIQKEEEQEREKQQEEMREEVCEFIEEEEPCGQTQMLQGGEADTGPRLVSMNREYSNDILLEKEKTIIGKLKGQVDTVLNLPFISRMHACIELRKGECYLTDLNSTNGTFLNGTRLNANESCILYSGDQVHFADAGYYFREEGLAK